MFSDKSRFDLQSDSRRVIIWREHCLQYSTTIAREFHKNRRNVIHVWGGIIINGCTHSHHLYRSPMRRQVSGDILSDVSHKAHVDKVVYMPFVGLPVAFNSLAIALGCIGLSMLQIGQMLVLLYEDNLLQDFY